MPSIPPSAVSGKVSSGSSLSQREALKKDFVKVPALSAKVDINSYVHLAQKLYEDANQSQRSGNLTGAYIDFQKFLVLILTCIPKHPAYATLPQAGSLLHGCVAIKGKAWLEEVRSLAMKKLEDVVKAMDEAEDKRKEEALSLWLMEELEDWTVDTSAAKNPTETATVAATNDAIEMTHPAEVIVSVITLESLKLLGDDVADIKPIEVGGNFNALPEAVPSAPTAPPAALDDSSYASLLLPPQPPLPPIPSEISSIAPLVPVRDARKLDILKAFPEEDLSHPATFPPNPPLPLPLTASSSSSLLRPHHVVVAGTVVPSPALRYLTAEDVLILKHILAQGSRFPLPPPATLPANLFFEESNLSIPLLKDDFHVSFTGFLGFLPPELQMATSAIETNRCFFIHIGIAIGLHPFLVQAAFREMASRLMQQPDCWYADLLESVLGYTSFVDANALCFLWPEEFLPYRFLFVSGSNQSPIFSTFVSHEAHTEGPQAIKALREVIIHCNGSHFTLLRRLRSNSTSESTIDQIMDAARRNRFIVQENVAQPCRGQRSIQEIIKLALSS